MASVRAVTYERVSVDRRDERRSVTEQHADNVQTIAREGWQHLESFVDNDRSASRYAKKARPGYLRLVELVARGGCDAVVTWELSRLSRDLGTLVAFRDLCREHGVIWSVGARTFDPADERDTLPLIVQACQAEGESAQTSKRVRRAMTSSALAGRPHGRFTYGYRREYDPTTKAFVAQVIDDDQAVVLREIADRFLAGEAFYAIARDLTGRGIPAPAGGARWHPTNCARLLKNAAYVGRRMQNGQYVADAVWPPIFSDATWASLQAKLSDPSRLTRHEAAIKHLLTGFALCGVCESDRMGTVKQRGGYRAYMCTTCFGVARRQDLTDQHVEAKIVERLSRPDVADLFGTADRADDEAASNRARGADLRQRLADLETEAIEGNISAAAFGRFEATLTEQIEEADAAAQRASVPQSVRHLAGVDRARVAVVWDALTIGEKRDALRAIGAAVTIMPTGRGRRTFDPGAVRVTFPM